MVDPMRLLSPFYFFFKIKIKKKKKKERWMNQRVWAFKCVFVWYELGGAFDRHEGGVLARGAAIDKTAKEQNHHTNRSMCT